MLLLEYLIDKLIGEINLLNENALNRSEKSMTKILCCFDRLSFTSSIASPTEPANTALSARTSFFSRNSSNEPNHSKVIDVDDKLNLPKKNNLPNSRAPSIINLINRFSH